MIKDIKNNFRILKYVLKCCKWYPFWSLVYIISEVLNAVLKVLVIADVVEMTSLAISEGTYGFNDIAKVLAGYIIISAVLLAYRRFYFSYINGYYQALYVNKLFEMMFLKVKKVDFQDFDNPEFYDVYSRAMRTGVSAGMRAYGDFVSFIASVLTIAALGTVIVMKSLYLIGIILISVILRIIISNKKNKNIWQFENDSELARRMHGYINRIFYQQRFAAEIKTTPVSDLLIEKFDEAQNEIDRLCVKAIKKNSILSIFNSVVSYLLETGGIYLFLGYGLFNNTLVVSEFASMLNAATQFSDYFVNLGNFVTRLKDNSLYVSNFLEFMKYNPTLEMAGKLDIKEEFESLEFKDVSFKYPGSEKYSVDNVNLKITKNEKLAIVGLNGAGKTTLIKLLLKFYNPEIGDIYYNNQTIRETNEDVIRKKFAIVFQDYRLYAVTVGENVLMRRVETKEDEDIVVDALKKVGLYEKVMEYPDGINTLLTRELDEKGASFSGGQLQRLAIARVLASDADIYILDEPTSNLDPIAERNINKLIIEESKQKTIIIIAHRLSTVVDADKIILIENGKIVESGSHEELMNQDGFYKVMFNTQASLYKHKNENECKK